MRVLISTAITERVFGKFSKNISFQVHSMYEKGKNLIISMAFSEVCSKRSLGNFFFKSLDNFQICEGIFREISGEILPSRISEGILEENIRKNA